MWVLGKFPGQQAMTEGSVQHPGQGVGAHCELVCNLGPKEQFSNITYAAFFLLHNFRVTVSKGDTSEEALGYGEKVLERLFIFILSFEDFYFLYVLC